MSPALPRVRALIAASKSVAEIRVAVQLAPGLTVAWQWDLLYPLWAAWGTQRTARWVADQFHHHDAALSRRVGAEKLRQAIWQALEAHRRFSRVAWLADVTT